MGRRTNYYTLKGYALAAEGELTSAMEDYLDNDRAADAGEAKRPGQGFIKNAQRQSFLGH
jgi:hypothetical protein